MREPTDKTIEILCGECDQNFTRTYEVGIQNMIRHIREAHPQYSLLEADEFATRWAEESYDRWDKFVGQYHENQKVVKAIRKDTGEL